MLDSTKLNDKLVSELREIAQTLGIQDTDTLRKPDLISKILEFAVSAPVSDTHEEESEILDANDSLDNGDKPRKRLRSTKPVSENKQHKD